MADTCKENVVHKSNPFYQTGIGFLGNQKSHANAHGGFLRKSCGFLAVQSGCGIRQYQNMR